MMRHFLLLITILLYVTSCAHSPSKFNRLSLGMTKGQAIDVLGDPDTTKASEGVEVLSYYVEEGIGRFSDYWVIFKEGKLASYGRAGDFGTAQPTTLQIQQR